MGDHLLSVVEHSKQEHGHQQQRRLLGPQEISVGRRKADGSVVTDSYGGLSLGNRFRHEWDEIKGALVF